MVVAWLLGLPHPAAAAEAGQQGQQAVAVTWVDRRLPPPPHTPSLKLLASHSSGSWLPLHSAVQEGAKEAADMWLTALERAAGSRCVSG